MPALALIRLLRPHQWTKNALVFAGALAAPGAATFVSACIAFAAFALISSAVYVFNDLCDADRDRLHPTKRMRPIASGAVTPAAAVALGCTVLAAGLALAFAASTAPAIYVAYLLLQLAYSAVLKHTRLDTWCIAAGFLLRYLAGTVGIGVAADQGLALCITLLILCLITSKRLTELGLPAAALHRPALVGASAGLLRFNLFVFGCGAVAAYALTAASPWLAALIAGGLLRYAYRIGQYGAEPGQALNDRPLLATVIAWALLV